MHEHQQNRRIAAARAFNESLEQLQNILPPEPQSAESDLHSEGHLSLEKRADAKIWEEAAADLDAFFRDSEPPQAGVWNDES